MVTKERVIPKISTIADGNIAIRIRQIGDNGTNSRVLPCQTPDPVSDTVACRFIKQGVGCGHPDGLIPNPGEGTIQCPLQKGPLRVVPTDINEK